MPYDEEFPVTDASFRDYISEVRPLEVEAFDPYHEDGDGDGYGFALSDARSHLADGGEWPYYIAAIPNLALADARTLAFVSAAEAHLLPEWFHEAGDDAVTSKRIALQHFLSLYEGGHVLETYCEGDLTAYIFRSMQERDEAAARWQESAADVVTRLADERTGEVPSENLAGDTANFQIESEG